MGKRVLLDENLSQQLLTALGMNDAEHQENLGWKGKSNGDLLMLAEEAGFEVLVTADKQLRFQQNFSMRKLALVTLEIHPTSPSNQLACASRIRELCEVVEAGMIYVIEGPVKS